MDHAKQRSIFRILQSEPCSPLNRRVPTNPHPCILPSAGADQHSMLDIPRTLKRTLSSPPSLDL